MFDKKALEDYKAKQSKRRNESLGVVLIIGLIAYFVGVAEAVLLGVLVAFTTLSEIDGRLRYANFLKEREFGLHDIED